MKQTAIKIGCLGLLIGLIASIYWPVFLWMNQRFFETGSYYTHGWLLAGAIVFLLWRRREEILSLPARPEMRGLFLVIPALLLLLGGRVTGINFLAAWSLPVVILGLALFNWGPGRTRVILGPVLLIYLMIPLPGVWIIALSFHLKTVSTSLGVAGARLLGIRVIRNGFELLLPAAPPGESLRIGAACSGLRSLLSFAALGGFFACLLPLTGFRRGLVFLAALLLAPLSNLIRVVSLIILRRTVGPEILAGPWHLLLGGAVFLICFLFFLQGLRWLAR
jgi:exosortase